MQKNNLQNKHEAKKRPEIRYSRLLFYLTLAILLIIPLIWLIKQPSIQEKVPILKSDALSLLKPRLKPGISPEPVIPPPTRDYEALKAGQSHKSIHIREGEKVRIWIDFKNTSRKTWYREGDKDFIAINVKDPIGRLSPFKAADWDKNYSRYPYRPGRMSHEKVEPLEVARFYITLQAPKAPGDYVENFGIVSEFNEWIVGGDIAIPIKVSPSQSPAIDETRRGDPIRVGIWDNSKAVEISSTGAFSVKDPKGVSLGEYARGDIVTTSFQDGLYSLQAPTKEDPRGLNRTFKDYLVFEPAAGEFMELVNFEARPRWNPSLNDNFFRGKLEYRHAPETKKTWVINIVPVEMYLRGVAEVGNSAPVEMKRALVVAERTYAEYHRRTQRKHKKDNFAVDNRYDQVYNGAGYELRSPTVMQAIKDTAGLIVIYNGELAVTPYFSRSDGKTRAFHEVWGGDIKPWLISVDVPWSVGKTRLGHGVGMDASAAVQMATEGLTYDAILKYFYQQTSLKQIY